ncbi:MAG: hypothetical protein IJA02_10570 [Clostridia bacterium]|nr:hypothetical protein [Clostridia bacterium]
MKNYIARIKANAKPIEIVWWWIFRAIMIFGILDSIFGFTPLGGRPMMVKQMAANLVGMFAWEICMATSKKNFMHYLPSYIQDISVIGFFMASFCGAYVNLYYYFRYYDLIFHIFGGIAGALFGYEAITAMQVRDKVKHHIPLVALAAFGVSFIAGNAWEIVEFVLDQFFGSDAQHWCYQEAQEAAAAYGKDFLANPHIIPHVISESLWAEGWTAETFEFRWALMDTMEDLLCNAVGGVLAYVFLLVYPYHHKGKYDVHKMIDESLVKETKQKEAVTK